MSDVAILDKNPVASTTIAGQAKPQNPVGSLGKEVIAGQGLPEFVKPAGPEVVLNPSEEERKLGVEARNDNPNLTSEHKDLVDHAGPHVPVLSSPSSSIQYPMTEEEVAGKLKSGENDDSGKWLAGLINKIIAVMGLN